MRRRLLSLAFSRFSGPGLVDLPFAGSVRDRLVEVVAANGYDVTDPVSADLSAAELAGTVQEALSAAGPGDVLIVHVLSHGREHGQSVQVYAADGQANSQTSVDSWLADATGDDEQEDSWPSGANGAGPGPWILFLVDVCGAGRAVRTLWQLDIADDRRRAWVIAGCLPGRPGFNGRFTQAAARVLADLPALDIHPSYPFVPLDRVARAIRDEVDRLAVAENGLRQTVVSTRIDIAASVQWPPFFDNPHYGRTIAGGVVKDLREFATAVEELFDAWHFMSRAAGRSPHDAVSLTGGAFRGRTAQLRTLSDWLQQGTGAANLHVVTGAPGVGKSALLGVLVCAAHPRLAEVTERLWWPRRDDLPPVIDELAAVHAHEQDPATVLGQAAAQLGLAGSAATWTVPAFVSAVNGRATPPVVVVDAIDEAINPGDVATMLRELADAVRQDGSPSCRLLVGTRSGVHWPEMASMVRRAASTGSMIDLDDEPREQLRADLRGYVEDLLRMHPDYRERTRQPVREALAAGIAQCLAQPPPDDGQPRWGEYLVAGLFVHQLTRRAPPADVDAAVHTAAGVPRSLPEVLNLDLTGPSHPWLYPVLAVLAHVFGAGIPRRLLAACASVFADPSAAEPTAEPTDADISAALHRARFYLRRNVDADGTTLYRLFHQALVDQLQRTWATKPEDGAATEPASVRAVQSVLLRRLLATAARRPDAVPDWGPGWRPEWNEDTDPYLRRHLIDHAAAAGEVDLLLADVGFVVHADPVTLARHLHRGADPAGRTVATVYRTSYARHRALARYPQARRGLLVIDATRHRQVDLAARLATGPVGREGPLAWRPVWATSAAIAPALLHTMIGHAGPISSAACARLADGTDIAITGGDDATARVWDLEDGSLRHILGAHTGAVTAVGHARLTDGTDCALTAGIDRLVRVWDLTTGQLRHTLTGHRGAVTALATTRLPDGRPVVVSAGTDGTARVWDLADGTCRHLLSGHTAAIAAVTCVRLADEKAVAVTAGADRTARVWDLEHGTCRRILAGHARALCAVASARLDDGTAVAVTAGVDHTASIWDLHTGARRHLLAGHRGTVRALGCLRTGNLTGDGGMVATASADATVRVWSLVDGRPNHDLTGHGDIVDVVATTRLASGQSALITGSADTTVRVWDPTSGTPRQIFAAHTKPVTALTATRLRDGRDVTLSAAADGIARIWDLTERSDGMLTGHTGPVRVIACGRLADRTPVAVTAGADTTVRVWDLTTGALRRVMTGHTDTVTAASVVNVTGVGGVNGVGAIAVTASLDGSVRAWDLEDGTCRHTFTGRFTPVSSLVCTRLADGTAIVAITGADRLLRAWDLADGGVRLNIAGYLDERSPLGFARLPDGAAVAVTRSRDRLLRLWNLVDGSRYRLDGVSERRMSPHLWQGDGEVALELLTTVPGAAPQLVHLSPAGIHHVDVDDVTDRVVLCARGSGRGSWIATLSDATGRVWCLSDGHLHAQFPGFTDPTHGAEPVIAVHSPAPGGDTIAAARADQLYIWHLTDGRHVDDPVEVQSFALPSPATALAAAPDGSLLIGFGSDLCRIAIAGNHQE